MSVQTEETGSIPGAREKMEELFADIGLGDTADWPVIQSTQVYIPTRFDKVAVPHCEH